LERGDVEDQRMARARIAAVHEAGHVVVACLKNVPFVDVFILPEEDPRWGKDDLGASPAGAVSVEYDVDLKLAKGPGNIARPRRETRKAIDGFVMYNLAGTIAEDVVFGEHLKDGDSGDLKFLNDLLDRVEMDAVAAFPPEMKWEWPWPTRGPLRDEYLNTMRNRVFDLVTRYRPAVMAVADELVMQETFQGRSRERRGPMDPPTNVTERTKLLGGADQSWQLIEMPTNCAKRSAAG
jgi:hypothetical protein